MSEPTTGEWTEQTVKRLLDVIASPHLQRKNVANAHNAALAAEREKVAEAEHQRDKWEQIAEELEASRDKLESQLHATSVDAVELLYFANVVEPYVSNAHCHGKTYLDKKLYDACLEIRKVIQRDEAWQQLAAEREANRGLYIESNQRKQALDAAENQIMMDTECIERIRNHGMKLEMERDQLREQLADEREKSTSLEQAYSDVSHTLAAAVEALGNIGGVFNYAEAQAVARAALAKIEGKQ